MRPSPACSTAVGTLATRLATALLAAAALAGPAPAQAPAAVPAPRITAVSPQGTVGEVRQVSARFSQAVVPLGDLRQPAPLALACQGAAPAGSGHWVNDKVWVFDFEQPLPPGQRCQLTVPPDWRPLAGTLAGPTRFQFATGGPAVLRSWPGAGDTVDEDQAFILQLNGPAQTASVAAHAWCEVEGLLERLPLRPLGGPERAALLKLKRLEQRADAVLVADCGRPLPTGAQLRLVWGSGIAAQADAAVRTTREQRLDFTVRPAFTADFSCERERASAPCLPIRPLSLQFSAPVPRALAAAVRLKPAQGAAIAPSLDADDRSDSLDRLVFKPPFAEQARYRVELPAGLQDFSGRPLANAASFPLAVATGQAPPLAKFAAAPFGVVEHAAGAAVPVTLRRVQADLRPAAAAASAAAASRPAGQVRVRRLASDAEVLAWYRRLAEYHETQLSAQAAGLPRGQWTTTVTEPDARGRPVQRRVDRWVATRELSLLKADPQARRLDLPQLVGGDPRPFEVVGIPLPEPGYHVLEIESPRLGAALLSPAAPMFVRTGVLVTNLGLHFKHGRERSLVWVTTLDRGRPVAGADVAVADCNGRRLWAGRTDAQGLATVGQALDADAATCTGSNALFVTARAPAAGTASGAATDFAFVFSDWHEGIEPWRFGLPTAEGATPDVRAHTVFDRPLLRAGETVSMKHFIRQETLAGLAALPADRLPTRLKIIHEGSDDEVTQPLQWPGGRSAVSSWAIPATARLGSYRVELDRPDAPENRRASWASGSFRVGAFRVPLVDARLAAPPGPVVAPASLVLPAQFNHASGGPLAQAPLRGTALLRPRAPAFAGLGDFHFEPPQDPQARDDSDEADRPERAGSLVADQQALATDSQGAASFAIARLPAITQPSELLAELSFQDPNGEVQTVATTVPLWPAGVVPGIQAQRWVGSGSAARFTALAVDTRGQPVAGQVLEVRGRLVRTTSSRKRLVGGFYAYDNRTELQDLGPLCQGRSDAQGRLTCSATLKEAGEVELIVTAQDSAGHRAQAATSMWVARQGALWFAQDNDDRIELLPEKRQVEPGETLRLQVRMPYREATALVTVEREGVLHTAVHTLRGDDPTIALKIDPAWAPNVYVSALVLRGRLREVPWYSFFTWGWRAPVEWARAYWHEGRLYEAPTALVDLAKPSFKLGVAALQVGRAAHALQVTVTPDKPLYGVRQVAKVRVKVAQGGRPLAGAEVAFAAVDEGLLALRDNDSWNLLEAMVAERPWGVVTSTAQGQVIGRRHFGRKAVAAGGGGGRGNTRELFDTLLLWRPRVVLDAQGEALIEVPVNDSLTRFRLVAVADAGLQQFGTGSAGIQVSQDLQLLSGLPPLVREGDQFSALLTLRNTTPREMSVRATLHGAAQPARADGLAGTVAGAPALPINLPPQDLVLPAGGAQLLQWPVAVPAGTGAIVWTAAVATRAGEPRQDRLAITQRVLPAVPLRVLQATLQPLAGPVGLPVAAPADALAASTGGALRGGLQVALQPRLATALPGLRRWFEAYPYSCLEQRASKALALGDAGAWSALVQALPAYLDSDGLASYFPAAAGQAPGGSDRLTAFLVSAAHEAGQPLPDATRARLLAGLQAFVEGRIQRRFWAPRADLDVRKLAALEALSRHGAAHARMLGAINLAPATWPNAALLDWLAILQRVPGVPDADRRRAEAQQLLRGRLSLGGTTLSFNNEADDAWWWLMDSADGNAARLILALLEMPGLAPDLQADLPRLLQGHLARQQRGAWSTTTANLWGTLALARFSAKFESTPVTGRSLAGTGGSPQAIDWARTPEGGALLLPWPVGPGTLSVRHEGAGRPWLTVQSLAAVPLKAAVNAGYALTRTVTAVSQQQPGRWSRGDVMRVRLQIDAQADLGWVAMSDPVPGGATLLGDGGGRDSAIAARADRPDAGAAPTFVERGAEAFRAYWQQLPGGRHEISYTLRLNNPGRFSLPPTRVEAMYAPDRFAELPNAPVEVGP